MRYSSLQSPVPEGADPGLFENDLVLKPPPYVVGEDHEALDLQLETEPLARPRRKGIPRPVMLGGWAAVLGVAVALVYANQPASRLESQPDVGPPAAAAHDLGPPAVAPSIAAEPGRF